MDLNLLKTFEKAAQAKSLTKAARLLGHPKSKVSRDLTKLEDELELTLMNRSSKGIVLTDKGLELAKLIRDPLKELNAAAEAIQATREVMKGSIKLTAPEDLSNHILARLVFDFMDLYPDIKIDLFSTNSYLDFQKRQIDLALRIGKLKDSSLIQRKVADIEVIFVATPSFLRSSRPLKEIKDLKGSPVAVIKNLLGEPLNQRLYNLIDPVFSSNSIPLVKEFAKESKGVATLPRFLCEEELRKKELVQVVQDELYAQRGLFLLSPPTKFTPEHVKTFKSFVYENLKSKLLPS